MFPWAEVIHINEDMSDHLPLLLKLNVQGRESRTRKKKRFHFENMWVEDEGCAEVVKEAWLNGEVSDPIDNWRGKVKASTEKLAAWIVMSFGNISHQIRVKERELKETNDFVRRKEMLKQVRELRRKEEILWWQRSKVHFLEFGDKNTRWFHERAMKRKRAKLILSIKDSIGNWKTTEEEITKVVVNFFAGIFSSSNPVSCDKVVELVEPMVTTDMNKKQQEPFKGE